MDNASILDNIRNIAETEKEMTVRLIIVPGINDSYEEISGRLEFVRSLGSVGRVDILKYHRLGAGKYAALGLAEPLAGVPECSDEQAEQAAKLAKDMGLQATIGG